MHASIRTSLVVFGAAAALLATSVPAVAEDWLSVRGGAGQNPARTFAPGDEFGVAWQSDVVAPTRPGCVVKAGDQLFSIVAGEDDPGLVRLIAFSAADGSQLWSTPQFPTGAPNCPATDGSRVFVGSGYRATSPVTRPAFTAFDAADGSQEWQHVFGPESGHGATMGSPVALAGQVHVQAHDGTCGMFAGLARGCTFTFDAAVGTLVSRLPVSASNGFESARWGHPVIESGVVIGRNPSLPEVEGSVNNLIARTLNGGAVAWQDDHDLAGAPIADDGTVFFVRRPAWPYDGPYVVVARDADSGTILWTHHLAPGLHTGGLVVGPGVLYVSTAFLDGNIAGRLVALDRGTGTKLWETQNATGGGPDGMWLLGSDVYANGQAFSATGVRRAVTRSPNASPNLGAAYADGTFFYWDSVNEGPARLVAVRDVSAPVVGADSPAATTYTATTRPTFGWHASDATGSGLASTRLLLSGVGGSGVLPATATSWQPTSPLADGHYTWTVHATDRVGNTSATPARALAIDTVAPSTFDLGLPDRAVAQSQAETRLTWAPAHDATSGVDRYEVVLDGALFATVPASACGPTVCAAPERVIGDGSHTWAVRAVDRAGHETTTPTRRLDVSIPPVAALAANPAMVLTGQDVRLDPAGSGDANGSIQRSEWDLDGNGSFETSSAGRPLMTTRFTTPGVRTVGVRVVDGAGLSATASAAVDVRPAPPEGEIGVSINNGDIATNDPDVAVSLVWPDYASHALISNDGGFGSQGGTALLPLAPEVQWKLQSSGPERLPKTLYLRFRGAGSDNINYTDDIILDESVPDLSQATTTPSGGGSWLPGAEWRPRQAAAGKHRIRVVATDKASGISRVVVSPTKKIKDGKVVTLRSRTALGIRKLDKVVSVKSTKAPRWVCVLDSAGNPSRWKALSAGSQ